MKICPAGAELFHMDGQTHRQTGRQTYRHDELIVALRTFATRLKTVEVRSAIGW